MEKSFIPLLSAPFAAGENCIVVPRALSHDFNALARALAPRLARHLVLTRGTEPYLPLSSRALEKAAASMTGEARAAAEFILGQDMPAFARAFHVVRLRVVGNHVYAQNLHHDAMTRGLCGYNDPTTRYLRPGQARKIGPNLYEPRAGAETLAMPPGAVWRQAGPLSDPDTEPFVHHAPVLAAGRPPRLLLTADGFLRGQK